MDPEEYLTYQSPAGWYECEYANMPGNRVARWWDGNCLRFKPDDAPCTALYRKFIQLVPKEVVTKTPGDPLATT